MADDKKPDERMYPFSEALPAVIREKLVGIEQNIMTKFQAMEATHQELRNQIEKAEEVDDENNRLINELRRDIERNFSRYVDRKEVDMLVQSIDKRTDTLLRSLRTEIDDLKIAKANLDGRFWTMGIVFTIISVAIPMIVNFVKK